MHSNYPFLIASKLNMKWIIWWEIGERGGWLLIPPPLNCVYSLVNKLSYLLLLNIVWTRTHINQNSTNLYEKNGNSNQKEPLTYYSFVWFFASPVQFHAFQFWRKRTLWDLNEQSWQLFSAKLLLCLMIISGKGSNRQHSWKSDFCHSKLISKCLNISKLVKTFFVPHQYFSDFF